MSQEDATSDGAAPTESSARLRRPTLERAEPRRGWSNLYAPGRADAAAREEPVGSATPPSRAAALDDATARVVGDGYRIVEENLRRGRQVAAQLRGAGREVADFAGRVEPPRVVTSFAQTLLDPALTEQVAGLARGLWSALGATLPAAPTAPPPAPPEAEARVPLHPQERADYGSGGARVLKLRRVGPDEWLADLEVDGEVRRVQIRAVDGEL